jgi:hypothetical protein
MDFFVLTALAVFTLIGIYRGFMQSIIRMLSVLLSSAISLGAYPLICSMARKTFAYTQLKEAIITHLSIREMVIESTKQGQSMLIESLPVPAVFKDSLMVNNNSVVYDLLGVDNIVDYIGGFLANIALNVIVSILLFVCSYAIIRFMSRTLRIMRRIPVLRTFGRAGGGISGLVIGVVFVWAMFALLDVFVSQPFYETVYNDIQQSEFAIYLYNSDIIRNLLMERMF